MKRSFLVILLLLCCLTANADLMRQQFVSPPASARPWVYWFWLNGNITEKGIKADLQAMAKVGIGGVLIMEVDQGAPVGPVDFMGTRWQQLFSVMLKEAARLGIEVNMNNDAGWNGSGGPWVTPDKSMKKVVFTETTIDGGQEVNLQLPQPETVRGFYKDITVMAFPKRGSYRVPNTDVKAAYLPYGPDPGIGTVPEDSIIKSGSIIYLKDLMDATGKLKWKAPKGTWTVMRFGYTCTGAVNRPAPASGTGLECDKLSTEGADANWNGMMGKLIAGNRQYVGKSLVATHVDSWEVGSQNWTEKMPDLFLNHSGYNLRSFLPAFAGYVVNSGEETERFYWDLRSTISYGVVNKYAARIRKLANQSGLRFSIEAYGSPCDYLPYGQVADEPMAEFWTGGGAIETCRGMASAGHISGKRIIGAESFTSDNNERWLQYPGSIKALGDLAFCEGINRFVFHRYAMQPWTNRAPGMTMGPWGLHYERTQTWWQQSIPWHKYLARCQSMLRMGQYVADVCYLLPETPFMGFQSHQLDGYNYDSVSPEIVIKSMTVKNGKFVLPSGMSYRLMVLPDTDRMTIALLGKIRDLVKNGGVVLGNLPKQTFGLSYYPTSNAKLKSIETELASISTKPGTGRVLHGMTVEAALKSIGVVPDCARVSGIHLNWIHRRISDGDLYFVANPAKRAVEAYVAFRVKGLTPELWHPESGSIEPAPVFTSNEKTTKVRLTLMPQESVFVVFRKTTQPALCVTSLKRNGSLVFSIDKPKISPPSSQLQVISARYGVLSDPKRTVNAIDIVKSILARGIERFKVADLAKDFDPAVFVIKTAEIKMSHKGRQYLVTGTDPETIDLSDVDFVPVDGPSIQSIDAHKALLTVWSPGKYELTTTNCQHFVKNVTALPAEKTFKGPFTVQFQPGKGAPKSIQMPMLQSLSVNKDPGVKYYSGSATYRIKISMNPTDLASDRSWMLDLGDVKVIAEVTVNGNKVTTLWKYPYRYDVTRWLRQGSNNVEVRVTNLWPNRQIGDEFLPEDSERRSDGTLVKWPDWVNSTAPSPTGRISFTSWRLWTKNDELLPSGLIGPVVLRPGQRVQLN